MDLFIVALPQLSELCNLQLSIEVAVKRYEELMELKNGMVESV